AAAAAMLTHAAGAYLLWPGSDQFAAEKASLWFWSLHPLANVLTPEGALRSLPALARVLIFGAALAAARRAVLLLERAPRAREIE
ncbi:MAG: hypothetical protein HY403_12265, partial [Elusimicrobia bacterium]|nr:hypothetical protein [Elusimicrobiota bacterium]